jgi:hypothetical protein
MNIIYIRKCILAFGMGIKLSTLPLSSSDFFCFFSIMDLIFFQLGQSVSTKPFITSSTTCVVSENHPKILYCDDSVCQSQTIELIIINIIYITKCIIAFGPGIKPST